MKIESKVNFHNRFDIEINGAWVGYAENIILNRAYNYICALNMQYAKYIHFGEGSGEPISNRDSLFSFVGQKSATTYETVFSGEINKMTRTITLNPEEYVGKTLTEIGFANGTTPNTLCTHAMIKDAEGNPLSISKTALDVVVIYATVFVSLKSDQPNLIFEKTTQNIRISGDSIFATSSELLYGNLIVRRLFGFNDSNPSIIYSSSERAMFDPAVGTVVSWKVGTDVVDAANKKRKTSTRLSITEGNSLKKIMSFALLGVVRYNPIIEHTITDLPIGIGDGLVREYEIPGDIQNLVIKKNGSMIQGVVSEPNGNLLGLQSFYNVVEKVLPPNDAINLFSNVIENRYLEDQTLGRILGTFKLLDSIFGKKIKIKAKGLDGYSYSKLLIQTSIDGEIWTERKNFYANRNGEYEDEILFNWDDRFIRFSINASERFSYLSIGVEVPKSKLILDSPPEQGALITVSGTVPYYPKTEDYVLDVEFELQFGEEL